MIEIHEHNDIVIQKYELEHNSKQKYIEIDKLEDIFKCTFLDNNNLPVPFDKKYMYDIIELISNFLINKEPLDKNNMDLEYFIRINNRIFFIGYKSKATIVTHELFKNLFNEQVTYKIYNYNGTNYITNNIRSNKLKNVSDNCIFCPLFKECT